MVFIALAAAALIAGIDQVLKYLAINNLSTKTTYPLITIDGKDWLNFTYVENRGAGFSILDGHTAFLIVFTSIVIISAIILLLTKKVRQPLSVWGVAFMIGGGAGNLIDRIFRDGAVVDYIDVRVINFAVFNFADCFVVIGVILLFISLVFFPANPKAKEKTEDTDKTVNEDE